MTSRRVTAAAVPVALAMVALGVLQPVGHLVGMLLAVLGSLLLIASSTLALNGSRPRPMPVSRAVRTVLATTAANALTPAGVGGALLTIRVHRRTGLTYEQATAAAALRTAAGAAVAVTVTVATAGTLGAVHLPMPAAPAVVAAVALLLAATSFLTATVPWLRRLARASGRSCRAAGDVLRRPRCCLSLIGGCLGVTAAQLLTLAGAVRAVGGHLALGGLLLALLGSAAARSALPSPGGVGPIEAALVTGLTALGMHLGSATLAVVVYRTAGHWLPVLAGATCARHLRRQALL